MKSNKKNLVIDNQINYIYLRIKDLPLNYKSYNYFTNLYENGVSVWKALQIKDNIIPILPEATTSAAFDIYLISKDYPKYLVTGNLLNNSGSISEPLLEHVKIVSELNSINIYKNIIKDNILNNNFILLYFKKNVNKEIHPFVGIRNNNNIYLLLTTLGIEFCQKLTSILDEYSKWYEVKGEIDEFDQFNRPILKKWEIINEVTLFKGKN